MARDCRESIWLLDFLDYLVLFPGCSSRRPIRPFLKQDKMSSRFTENRVIYCYHFRCEWNPPVLDSRHYKPMGWYVGAERRVARSAGLETVWKYNHGKKLFIGGLGVFHRGDVGISYYVHTSFNFPSMQNKTSYISSHPPKLHDMIFLPTKWILNPPAVA